MADGAADGRRTYILKKNRQNCFSDSHWRWRSKQKAMRDTQPMLSLAMRAGAGAGKISSTPTPTPTPAKIADSDRLRLRLRLRLRSPAAECAAEILEGVRFSTSDLWWPLEVTFINVNRNGLHHRNQRPKEYMCANFGQFWRGSAFWPLTFGDLWRSRLWMWIGTDFTIVISVQKSTGVPISVNFWGGPLFDLWPLVTSGGHVYECESERTSPS